MTDTPLFPADLTVRDQWCLWRIEPDRRGRPTKVPYRPDGRKAASNNPTTWSAFDAVRDVLRRQSDSYGGVGYFFADDDGTCGVDLDVSLDDNGEPQPWATQIIDRFQDAYRAFSVSGCGLHVICRATLPGKGRNFSVPNSPTGPDGKRAQIGLFDRGRFFALTGRIYRQSPLILTDHQETIAWLLDLMQPRHRSRQAQDQVPKTELTDSDVLDRARRARNGAKFAKLWAGEWEGSYARSQRPTWPCVACWHSGAARTRLGLMDCSGKALWRATSGSSGTITGRALSRPPWSRRPSSTTQRDAGRLQLRTGCQELSM